MLILSRLYIFLHFIGGAEDKMWDTEIHWLNAEDLT